MADADSKAVVAVSDVDPPELSPRPSHKHADDSLEQESLFHKPGSDASHEPASDVDSGAAAARTGGLTVGEREALLRADPTLSPDPPLASKVFDFLVPARWKKASLARDPDASATQPSVFDIPELCAAYEPPDTWENKKNWDPALRWTWREEREVIRKIDWNVLAWIAFFFAILNLGECSSGPPRSSCTGWLTHCLPGVP